MNGRCENCILWNEIKDQKANNVRIGHCQRMPPSVQTCAQKGSHHPLTVGSQWCGEHSFGGLKSTGNHRRRIQRKN